MALKPVDMLEDSIIKPDQLEHAADGIGVVGLLAGYQVQMAVVALKHVTEIQAGGQKRVITYPSVQQAKSKRYQSSSTTDQKEENQERTNLQIRTRRHQELTSSTLPNQRRTRGDRSELEKMLDDATIAPDQPLILNGDDCYILIQSKKSKV